MPTKLIVLTEKESFFLPHLVAKLARDGLIDFIVVFKKNMSAVILIRSVIRAVSILGIFGFLRVLFDLIIAFIANILFKNKYYSLEKVSKNFSIPLYYINDLNSIYLKKLIKNSDSKTVFAQVSVKIKKELLDTGYFINKHCLLPKFAGVFPVFWGLLAGEKEIGVTLYEMDQNYDAGPILRQKKIFTRGHSFFSAYHELYDISFELLKDWCSNKKIIKLPDEMERSYHSYPTYDEFKAFKKSGLKIGSAFVFHKNIY